jgi:hypothetical protein
LNALNWTESALRESSCLTEAFSMVSNTYQVLSRI